MVAIALILLLAPANLLLMLVIKIVIGSPISFIQTRPSLNGKPFNLIKSRTMKMALDADGSLLPDDQRIKKFGSFLRKNRLDELPELWSVVRGEVSIEGPRSLLMQYFPLYTKEQAKQHEVRPGITGWAQVNGRNALSWEEKFPLGVRYVDQHSLWLDIKTLSLTIATVFGRSDIRFEGHATFKGNNDNE